MSLQHAIDLQQNAGVLSPEELKSLKAGKAFLVQYALLTLGLFGAAYFAYSNFAWAQTNALWFGIILCTSTSFVSFMLTDGLQIKKVSFLDTVFEGTKADDGGFDTDVAIATGELVKLIPDLIEALGGETESGVAGAAQAVASDRAETAPAASRSPMPAAAPSAPARKVAGGGVVTGPREVPVDTDPESAPF